MAALLKKPAGRERYDLILIRGAPGVGKTALAEHLKEHYPSGVTVEVDSLKVMINRWDWRDSAQYRHILEAAGSVCRSYFDNGYAPVIVVDPFSCPVLDSFISMVRSSPRKPAYFIITLFCDPPSLEQRIQSRTEGFNSVKTALAINEEMRRYRFPREELIDTSGKSTEEAGVLVLGTISPQQPRAPG